ncbi:hypothetical protein FEE95_20930 [Maribacter algarum]|uniref:RHS repeat-associated core domain-containing protein n=1 Tax=Maribacter algarum (ex Zhang et al. 2020) TaxID=2578118 RepID=A0A5S3PDZ2_9FLAO|nr:RHS repeat-associated core domain-containing protein [Maribacter algarum]TMM52155.1 hypothetical protein FEE95_20930 [Maribacter algarum]
MKLSNHTKIRIIIVLAMFLGISSEINAQGGGCFAAGTNLSFPASGGTQNSAVQGGCSDGSTYEWQIGSKPSWVSAFANGTTSVTVIASANTQGARTGTVQLVKNGSQIGVFSVSQAAGQVTVGQVSITSGPTQRCSGSGTSDFNASATNASSYSWTLTPGAGTINSSGTVTWNSSYIGTAIVQVTANGPNNSTSTASRNVSVVGVSTPSLQTNLNEICSGEQATLTMGPLQSSVRYQLLRNGTVTGQEVTTNSNGQPGGISWDVFSGGTYSVRGTQLGGLGCSNTWGTLVIDENAGLGNPSINGPSQLCSGTAQTDFNISGNNGTNTYVWSILNGGPATINSSTGLVTWNGSTSTATIRLTATSECGTTTNINKSVSFDLISTPGLQANMNEFCTGDQVMLSLGPLQSSVRYELLKDGIFTGFEVTTDSNGQPGGTSWDVSSGGTYSVRATKSTGLNCSITYGSLPIIEKANLGNPVLSDPGTRCRQTGTSTLNVTGGSSANTYSWTLTNAGSSTINGSGTSATINWPASFSGTAIAAVEITSECGTTTTLSRLIVVTEPDIWYADTDGDNYEDPGGATQQSCTQPAGNWTNTPQGPDQCPLQPAPGTGTNGCDPDCADGYFRPSGSNDPPPAGNYVPVEFSFQEAGGIAYAELVFPNGSCTQPYEITFLDPIDEWATFTFNSATNSMAIEVEQFVSVNGSSSRGTGSRVAINGIQVGILGANQTGPPVFPTCDLTTIRVDGTDIPLATDIDYPISSDTKAIQIVFDPLGCAGEITLKDYNNPNDTPEWSTWLSYAPVGNSTFNFTTQDNNTGQSRIAYIGIYKLDNDEFLGLFRISQTSCLDMEWYPDQDGDGQGDATAVPRGGCDAPTDETYSFVKNNNDLCPFEAGTLENQGCPPGTAPENRNTVTTLTYDIGENLTVGSKFYFDEIGKLEQVQAWDIKSDSIWTSATLYDEFGFVALQTLSAPIKPGSNFEFKEGFIKKADNVTDYALDDYDGVNREEPLPVGDADEVPNNIASATLGWYYSENNIREGFQDVTNFPFTKSIYSDLNPGKMLRIVGGNKINGEWSQKYAFSMKASDELSLTPAFGDVKYSDFEITKTISRDVHGVENVEFTDSDGKLLATARSGPEGAESPLLNVDIPEQGFIDIHIPEGITGFTVSNPSEVTIYNLITEQKETDGTVNLSNGFYRVAVNDMINFIKGSIYVSYKVNYYDYSLNVYDEADRLVKSYQPLASIIAEKPVSTYIYDALGQLIEISSPDEGSTQFKYRENGQIRFSQDSKQKDPNDDGDYSDSEFSYFNYDSAGRLVESGVYIEDSITFVNSNSIIENELDDINLDTDGLANASCKEQKFTLYDKLDTSALHNALSVEGIGTSNYPVQKFLSGNVSKTYTVQTNASSSTWYSYDIYGRIEWVIQQIDGLGVKTIDYEYYPISGQIYKIYYQKHVPSERFIHRYNYNEADKLVTVETSTDDSTFILNANHSYYENGSLKRTELADGVQGVDYIYNLNGLIKGINHPSLDSNNDPSKDSNDLFGMQIDYHSDDYKRDVSSVTSPTYGTDRLNGDIKGVRWKNDAIPGMTNELMYAYEYNRNNWLLSADFDGNGDLGDTTEPIVTSIAVVENNQTLDLKASQSITLLADDGGEGFHAKDGSMFSARITQDAGGTTIMEGDYDVSNLTYDANGNILSLRRKKGSDGAGNAMDDLSYNYKTKTNQLEQVVDIDGDVPNAEDFETQLDSQNYVYNSIGQLIENKAANLTYQYNSNRLLIGIKRNNLNLVKFYYNDRFQRVRKESYLPNGFDIAKTTNYVRDIAGSILAIYTENTLVEQPIYGNNRIGVYYKQDDTSVYEIKDYLGNVRATFMKSNTDAIPRSASDYYPFGGSMPGRNLISDYRYSFQGQEKDIETGKESFDLRLWDSSIGRWISPDPEDEFYSPYLGIGNNPINHVDKKGDIIIVTDARAQAVVNQFMIAYPVLYQKLHSSSIVISIKVDDLNLGAAGTLRKQGESSLERNFGKSNVKDRYRIMPFHRKTKDHMYRNRYGNIVFTKIPTEPDFMYYKKSGKHAIGQRISTADAKKIFDNDPESLITSAELTLDENFGMTMQILAHELGHIEFGIDNDWLGFLWSLIEPEDFYWRGHSRGNPNGEHAIFREQGNDATPTTVISPRDF